MAVSLQLGKVAGRIGGISGVFQKVGVIMMPSSKPGQSGNASSCWWAGAQKIEMEQSEIRERGVRTVPNVPMQLPDCPVCWEGFDDGPRMPRLLHCGHTICQVCLENLLFESGLGQRCVRCPECRGVCVWRGLHELPKNYILLRVMSSSSSSSLQKPPLNPPTRPHNVSLFQWPNLPLFPQISHFTSFATENIPRLVEQKLWDIGKLLWALGVMLLFVPLSFTHMILAWLTAILGSFVFIWFSIGSMGIAVFMFFTWCSYNLAQFLVEFSWIQFNRMCLQPTPYDLLRTQG